MAGAEVKAPGRSGDYFLGTVTSSDISGGAVLQCTDPSLNGEDVNVVPGTVENGMLSPGDTVCFRCTLGEDGRPQAVPPLWQLAGLSSGEPTLGEYVGKITRIIREGSGFVECAELSKVHGRDVFLHQTVVEQCGLAMGDTISFSVHISNIGNPQVSAPCWKCCDPGSSGQVATPRAAVPAGGGKGVKGAAGKGGGKSTVSLAELDAPGRSGDYFLGTVTSSDHSGAVAQCTDPSLNGEDVNIVPGSVENGMLSPGDTVCFRCTLGDDGRPQAVPPVWQLVGLSSGEPNLGDYVGRVARIIPNGSGFVECPELQKVHTKDVFLHQTVVEQCGLAQGDVLSFTIHTSSNGDPQVSAPCWKCCTPGASGPGTPAAAPVSASPGFKGIKGAAVKGFGKPMLAKGLGKKGGPPGGVPPGTGAGAGGDVVLGWMPPDHHVGRVLRMEEERGVTYVRCPNSGLRYDVYVHNSVADPGALLLNDVVAFPLHLNQTGKPQASSPFWKLVGWTKPGIPIDFGDYTGLVVRVLQNGSGFVASQQIHEQLGKDIYIHEAVMKQCGLEQGNLISFKVHMNAQGNPQVSAPCWICCSSAKLVLGEGKGKGKSKGGKSQGKGFGKKGGKTVFAPQMKGGFQGENGTGEDALASEGAEEALQEDEEFAGGTDNWLTQLLGAGQGGESEATEGQELTETVYNPEEGVAEGGEAAFGEETDEPDAKRQRTGTLLPQRGTIRPAAGKGS